MRDVETQLGDYWAALIDEYPVPSGAELMNSSAPLDETFDSGQADTCERCGGELPVVDLRGTGERPAPTPRKRRARVLAVAAAILFVVGVVVVTDQDDDNVETEPVLSATTPAPVPSPTAPDPTPPPEGAGPPPSVVDSLGYRWSRVPDTDGAFAYAGIYEPGFGGHDRAGYSESAARSMASVTVGGPGLVAVGSSGTGGAIEEDNADAAVWTSVDGVTWSAISHVDSALGGPGDQQMTSVTTGGPGLVAVGSDQPKSITDGAEVWSRERAAVWTSVDGLTWSRVPHDESVFGGAGARYMTSVTVGGPGLVAVGAQSDGDFADEGDVDAAVWVSVDGLTWSRVPHDESVFGGAGPQEMRSVTAGGPGLVAVGADGLSETLDAAVWTSVDGITWSRVPDDAAVLGGADSQYMSSVTAGGPGLVAVGFEGVWDLAEVDGVGPNRVPDAFGDADPAVWDGVYELGAAAWISVDGTNWARLSDDTAVFGGANFDQMSSVTAGGTGLVAVGTKRFEETSNWRSTVWTSVEGITWSRVPDDETVFGGRPGERHTGGAEMTSVATWGPALVAVGHARACCFDGGALDAVVWIATLDN